MREKHPRLCEELANPPLQMMPDKDIIRQWSLHLCQDGIVSVMQMMPDKVNTEAMESAR